MCQFYFHFKLARHSKNTFLSLFFLTSKFHISYGVRDSGKGAGLPLYRLPVQNH